VSSRPSSPSEGSFSKATGDQVVDRSLRAATILQGYSDQQLVRDPAAEQQERSRPLSATIVFSRDEVTKLAAFVGTLVAEPGMVAPRFFLASVSERKWKPCVVVVSREDRTVGLLYCKERLVAGIGTRIAFGDDALGTMVVADPEETESIIHCAVKALLKHMVGVRFLVSSGRLSFVEGLRENADLSLCPARRHAHLRLPRTYDEFLVRMGPQLRRNFRRYRRRSEMTGNEFSPDHAFPDFCTAARRLFPNSAFATSERDLERCLAMIESMPSRLLIGLRGRNGESISLAGGWYVGDRAILNMQLNDRRFGRDSLSLVLRSYLIEALIRRGFRELVFWAGTSPPLSFYSESPEQWVAYIDAPSMWWRLFRLAFRTISKFDLIAFRKSLKLIVPYDTSTIEGKEAVVDVI
jgi:hypothetical protein